MSSMQPLQKARTMKQIAVTPARVPRSNSVRQLPRLARSATIAVALVDRPGAVERHSCDDVNASPDTNTKEQQPRRAPSSGLYGELIETLTVETLCWGLDMTKRDVWQLRKQFISEDADSTGSITLAAFFSLVHLEQHNLAQSLLRLADIPSEQQQLSFDEYLACVCAFASLQETDLLQFFYDVCTEASAMSSNKTMGESDIFKLGKELQAMQSSFSKNVGVATKKMASSRNPVLQQPAVTFDAFLRMSQQHRVAFYPLFQMQRNVRVGTLGEAYWIAKTREKHAVAHMVEYMVHHNGRVLALDWKSKLSDCLFRRESFQARVRRRARAVYDAHRSVKTP